MFLFNFAEISQLLLDAKGMVIVKNANEIADYVLDFFTNADERKIVGDHAYQVVAANRCAVQKQLELIKSILTNYQH